MSQNFLNLSPKNGTAGTGAEGNTSPQPRRIGTAKGWFLTFNNYPENWEELFKNQIQTFGTVVPLKWVLGEEIAPTTGTPHLQGYILFNKRVRPMSLFTHSAWQKVHWEAAKGSPQQNYEYCTKDGKFISYGFPKPIKIIQVLRPWQQGIEDLIKTEPDDRTIHWYWEPNGNIGKSALVKYLHIKYKALFCQSGKEGDILYHVFKSPIEEMDPGIVLYDIPRSHEGHVSYSALEQIKNGMVFSPKYESGSKVFNPPHIIIFANFPPAFPEKLSADRWKITELNYLRLNFK